MKNIILSLSISVLIFIGLSCSKILSDNSTSGNPRTIVKGNYTFLKSAQLFIQAEQNRSVAFSAPFDISKVERSNDSLKVTVSYLQGCAVSNFDVIWSGLALQTYPETIVLILKRTTSDCGILGSAASQVLSINLTECLGDAALAKDARIVISNASETADATNADITVNSDIVLNNDTISLNQVSYTCNLQFNTDTCFFQHIGDTLRIYGKVLEFGCGRQIAVITEKSDSILINTSEIRPAGADCDLALSACFEFRIPGSSGYSVVKFNGKTYTGF